MPGQHAKFCKIQKTLCKLCRGRLFRNKTFKQTFIQTIHFKPPTTYPLQVKPSWAPKLHVEKLETVYDWKGFFEPWPCKFSGHCQSKSQTTQGLKAPHVFKFVLRRDLQGLHGQIASEFGEAPHPYDVVLLCKQFLGSQELSQAPTVCVPWSFRDLVGVDGPHVLAAKNKLADRVATEFRKTSKLLKGYQLSKASAYLDCLVSPPDEAKPPPVLDWVRKPARDNVVEIMDLPSTSLDFATATVRIEPRASGSRGGGPDDAGGVAGVVAGRMIIAQVSSATHPLSDLPIYKNKKRC